MKRTLLAIALSLMTACSSCNKNEDDSAAVYVDPYPWASDECSNEVSAQPCNFELLDQNDAPVNLYDFYGSVIVLDLSAMWCGPCQIAGMDVQNTVERFSEYNIKYVTVLVDNRSGETPTLADVQEWANMMGIETEPVLQGSRDLLNADPTLGWPLESWPTFILITSDMKVHWIQKGYNQQTLDMLIEDTISQSQP